MVDYSYEEGCHLGAGHRVVGAVSERRRGGASSGHFAFGDAFDGPYYGRVQVGGVGEQVLGFGYGLDVGEGGDHHDGHVGAGYYAPGVEVAVV